MLAEKEAHGYELRRRIHDRGFRYWADLGRTSIYNAIAKLERAGLLEVRAEVGGGPSRKVYRLTAEGLTLLRRDAIRRLLRPAHPRSQIDLGIYALPLLGEGGLDVLEDTIKYLESRAAFLEERLEWCRARGLELPALGFERPLLALRAELSWLCSVLHRFGHQPHALRVEDWARYEYLEPPDTEA